MSTAYYPAIIERGASGYGVFFPDLPGCTSAGDTLQEAAKGAEEALQGWIEVSAEHGDNIPPPSEPDAIATDPDVVKAARVLVRADLPEGRAHHDHPAGKPAGRGGFICQADGLHPVRAARPSRAGDDAPGPGDAGTLL